MGVGYSYAENGSALVTSDWEAAADATALLKALATEVPALREGSPLFLVAESYGGKFAVTTALTALKAIRHGHLKAKLGGTLLEPANNSLLNPLTS